MSHTPPAPRERLRLDLEDVRSWLLEHIDGGEEVRGYDSVLSGYINTIDAALAALPSETGPIPASKTQAKRFAAQAGTPLTDAAVVTMLRLDGDADVVVDAYFARTLERELIDLKQRLLPQFQGRAQRAEHERDALLEQLIAARSATVALPVEEGATDPMENWLMRGALEWLEQAEHGVEKGLCKNIAVLLRTLWRGDKQNLQHVAPGSSYMKGEPDRPDWARQLPGAEIYDRAARGDHGYDRTASLSAGRYVCLCGGTCSHHDASQPSLTTREQP